MPNYVKNVITMEGIGELPVFTKDENGREEFDFNKLIPMPESLDVPAGCCVDEAILYYLTDRCKLAFEDLSKDSKDFLYEKYRGTWSKGAVKRMFERDCGSTFDRIKDLTPEGIQEYYNMKEEDFFQLGKTYIDNFQKYGATTWYEWRCQHWNTKWNASSSDIQEDEISFETAWSQPEPILLKLSEMYPDKPITHSWADELAGENAGYQVYQAGKVVEGGHYPDYSNNAFEMYIECWGGPHPCMYQDLTGWHIQTDCKKCGKC